MNKQEVTVRVRAVCRVRRLSRHTEASYLGWILRFARHVKGCSPECSREERVRLFLEGLAARSSASTQNQALNAIVFFYRDALRKPLGDLGKWARAKRPKRIPTWLTHSEMMSLLANGASITQVQELLGHASVETTQVYLHCIPRFAESIRSPMDAEPENIVPMMPQIFNQTTTTNHEPNIDHYAKSQ